MAKGYLGAAITAATVKAKGYIPHRPSGPGARRRQDPVGAQAHRWFHSPNVARGGERYVLRLVGKDADDHSRARHSVNALAGMDLQRTGRSATAHFV